MSALHRRMGFVKVGGGGGEGRRGGGCYRLRRGRGGCGRGARRSALPARERGPRRRAGKLKPALPPPRGPLAALRLPRRGWAAVLPPREPSRGSSEDRRAPSGTRRPGPRAAGTPRRRAVLPRDSVVGCEEVECEISVRPTGHFEELFFLFYLWENALHRWGRCKQRDCKHAYLEQR